MKEVCIYICLVACSSSFFLVFAGAAAAGVVLVVVVEVLESGLSPPSVQCNR